MDTSSDASHNASLLPSPRQPASTVRLVRRLWTDYLSAYRGRLALALGAMAAYAASASAIPLGIEWINDAFTGRGADAGNGPRPRDALVIGPILVMGLGAANALAGYFQARLSAGAAIGALRDLQAAMFDRLVGLDLAQTRAAGSGQMVARFANDPLVLRETLSRAARAAGDALTLLGLCGVMIYYDWILFAVVIGVYALIGWPVSVIGRRLRKSSRETQAQAGDVAGLVGETVAGAWTTKTLGAENALRARGAHAFDRRRRLLEKVAYTRALNEPMIFFVGALALGVVVAVVAGRIMAGALNASQFISFIVALLMLSQPARGLSTLNAVLQEGLGAFERMLEVIDVAPTIREAPDAPSPPAGPLDVTFKEVAFSYDALNDVETEHAAPTPALRGLTLTAAVGSTTALVGPSGAGKSTVFNLLTRLYDVKDGAVEIAGADIRTLKISALRRSIAVVGQDAFLFNDTIATNIALGAPNATVDDIKEAARRAAAHEFIEALPDGYDTIAGEGGANLSGGERQRIAIARAFAKDAPILLLDEATSALDAVSEARIKEALAELRRGRTTLIIAHRLATVRDADQIAVMENGKVVELGTHDQLVEADGVYANLVALQFSA